MKNLTRYAPHLFIASVVVIVVSVFWLVLFKGKVVSRVVQISTNTMGDNNTCEMKMITTLLYDDGRVFEGSNEVVGGEYGSLVYAMVWNELALPVFLK